jgi:hypothetical protein
MRRCLRAVLDAAAADAFALVGVRRVLTASPPASTVQAAGDLAPMKRHGCRRRS